MKIILTLSLILISLKGISGGQDSTLFLNQNTSHNINLHLSNTKDIKSSTNGWITLVAGIGFTTIGILMERDRIKSDISYPYRESGMSKRIFYDYSIMTIGVTLSVTGGIMINKSR